MEKQIFWIASFPKSGNTLMRAIIASLFFTKDGSFKFDLLKHIPQFEKTELVYKNKKIFGNDFDKINSPPVFYKYIRNLQNDKSLGILNQDFIFLKTHSGLFNVGGHSFTSISKTKGIIYIVRDPRDVCLSWSRHYNISVDRSIENIQSDILNSNWVEPKEKKFFNLNLGPKSFISSWDKHIYSWTSNKWEVPIKIIRYEDLVYNKKKILIEIIDFFKKNFNYQIQKTEKKIDGILISTDFNKFKREEKRRGFIEATGKNSFFSVGEKDQWRKKLTKKQLEKIEKKFGKIMKKFNYKLAVEF
mgnify:CR=1 FL=1